MSELLFDTPIWLPLAIAAMGVYLFLTGNRSQDKRVRLAGVGVVLLGVGLFTVSQIVDTDREITENRTRAFLNAFEKRDWNAMRAMLDPQATLSLVSSNIYGNRDQIMTGAERAAEEYGISNVRMHSIEVKQDDTLITVSFEALSDQSLTGQGFPSSWQFEWQNLSAGWTLKRIVCLRIGNETGERSRRQFPSP